MPIDPDLLAIVVDALEAANEELEMLEGGDEAFQDAIVPRSMNDVYREHMAMKAVISRIARAAPPERKRRLGLICRGSLEEAWPDVPELRIPVLPEVMSGVADALEVVRRRGLVDGDVRDALRELV